MDLFDDSESESDSDSDSETENYCILLPETEIPKSLNFNHQSFGNSIPETEIPKSLNFNHQSFENSISFKVGCKFPKLVVCVALRSAKPRWYFKEAFMDKPKCYVYVSVNGCEQYSNYKSAETYEQLWLFSISIGQLNKPNLSKQNQVKVEVKCDIGFYDLFEVGNQIKWLGVNVECICCPKKSDITYLPLPSDRNGCGSSSVKIPSDRNFQPVSNTIYDLSLLKGIHNDGCDSDERESEPPLFPDLANGFDFGFVQPNLELGSGVSSGFHLGSSSMANASVNDDSDFYMGSTSMAHDCVNDDSDFNMGPPPKKARTS